MGRRQWVAVILAAVVLVALGGYFLESAAVSTTTRKFLDVIATSDCQAAKQLVVRPESFVCSAATQPATPMQTSAEIQLVMFPRIGKAWVQLLVAGSPATMTLVKVNGVWLVEDPPGIVF